MYQIKFCNFVPVRQKNANMNRIKEALESKGIGQTELANRLGKTFNMVNLYATKGATSYSCTVSDCRHLENRCT